MFRAEGFFNDLPAIDQQFSVSNAWDFQRRLHDPREAKQSAGAPAGRNTKTTQRNFLSSLPIFVDRCGLIVAPAVGPADKNINKYSAIGRDYNKTS